MPFSLKLPQPLTANGWKVKIRDKERVEPPHISIIRKMDTWRWGLREQDFLDKRPPPREVPLQLQEYIQSNRDLLIAQWDKMYPMNPVQAED